MKLSNVRLILGDDYKSANQALDDPSSHCHVLRPTGMDIQIHKSSIEDIQLPTLVFILNVILIISTWAFRRIVGVSYF